MNLSHTIHAQSDSVGPVVSALTYALVHVCM